MGEERRWHLTCKPALKAGSRVLTVCVREMATAAKERLAAMWPRACMDAGAKIIPNSFLVTGRPKEAFFAPAKYASAQ